MIRTFHRISRYDLMAPAAAMAMNGVAGAGDKAAAMGGLKGLECQLAGLSIAAPASSTMATTTASATTAGLPLTSKEAGTAVGVAEVMASSGSSAVAQTTTTMGTGQLAAALGDHEGGGISVKDPVDSNVSGTSNNSNNSSSTNPHPQVATGQPAAHEVSDDHSNAEAVVAKGKRDEQQQQRQNDEHNRNNANSGGGSSCGATAAHGNIANGNTVDPNNCVDETAQADAVRSDALIQQQNNGSVLMLQ